MKLICPDCGEVSNVEGQSAPSVPCPRCGRPIGSKGSTPHNADVIETKTSDLHTGVWDGGPPVEPLELGELPFQVGRYRIDAELARGGFGRVFRATDTILGRPTALKIPVSETCNTPEKRQRFLDEARLAAKLRHVGIVTVFDVGELQAQIPYIAMEFVAGQSLAKAMADERLSVERAVDLLAKIADAVHYAHGRSVVHRDLKPSNILLDERAEPRVVDFGLAVHEDSQAQLRGQVAGTASYMAPEQFRGAAHHLDGRCDIWSLGVIFYQMLTGRKPFQGGVDEIREQVLERDPKPLRQIDDRIPAELETICLKCLEKQPSDRYPTALDLAGALRSWRKGLLPPDQVRPDVRQQAAQDPLPRASAGRRKSFAAIALFILLALASLPLFLSSLWTKQDSLPAVNLIETRGKPLVWIPLPEGKPKRLVWGGDTENSRWLYDPDRRELDVLSTDVGFFGMGETKLLDFRLQATIRRDQCYGDVGLFWGYRAGVDENGDEICRCEAVSMFSPEETPTTVYIERLTYSFLWKPKGILRPGVTRKGRGDHTIPLPVPPGGEFNIAITITDGGMSQLHFQDKRLDEMQDELALPTGSTPGAPAWVGVFHNGGESAFRDVQFKILHSRFQPSKEQR